MQAVNEYHLKKHKPQICPICRCTFALPSLLIRHSYDHEEQQYQCDVCKFTSHFESELNAHKIVHRKTPTFKVHVQRLRKMVHAQVGVDRTL